MSNRLETLPDSATLPITVRLPVSDVRRLAALTAATPYATRNKLVCAAIPRQSRRGQPKGTKCQ